MGTTRSKFYKPGTCVSTCLSSSQVALRQQSRPPNENEEEADHTSPPMWFAPRMWLCSIWHMNLLICATELELERIKPGEKPPRLAASADSQIYREPTVDNRHVPRVIY
jgi:hypothetical protein